MIKIPWFGRKNRSPHSREELLDFLTRVYPGEGGDTANDKLRLLILGVLMQFPAHERVFDFARRRNLGAHRAEAFLRGDVEFGFREDVLAGLLRDCDADPLIIEVALLLFQEFPRREGHPTVTMRPQRHPAPAPAAPTLATPDANEPEPATDTLPVPVPPSAKAPAIRADEEPVGVPAAKPDPSAARTTVELMNLLQSYRLWRGRRSYRKMSDAIGNRYAHTTLSQLPRRTKLPTLDLFLAFIEGCGGDQPDIQAWKEAWQRIALTDPKQRPWPEPPDNDHPTR
ncbi:hypothetical protein [Spirillospora sp. CA-128828]|uniref:hypothetical protein n=1 Tax=Spirillospora sp. CA-128828 TaxID=3240033 RepID=UPI003D8A4715